MIDVSNNVRDIYLSLLNGNISYNGTNVPVYGENPFNTPPKRYVIISDIAESSSTTNQSTRHTVSVQIYIYSEQYRTNDLSIVDNIANQILEIIIPDTAVNGFSDADVIVYPVQRSSSRYVPLQSGDNYIARKIINISNLVNEK